MPRTVKIVKDNDDNEIEVYADNCIMCQKEMVFPKDEADRIEEMFPFVKEKVDRGTPCVECAIKQEKQNVNIFSEEEIEHIKQFLKLNK